jgi:hypothetical protein
MLGAMICWWIGGLRGSKVGRLGLARQKAQNGFGAGSDDAGCDSKSKAFMKQLINEPGGVSIDEHGDLMPYFRWV